MNTIAVAVIADADGRRPDTTVLQWSLVRDDGDTMIIEVQDAASNLALLRQTLVDSNVIPPE